MASTWLAEAESSVPNVGSGVLAGDEQSAAGQNVTPNAEVPTDAGVARKSPHWKDWKAIGVMGGKEPQAAEIPIVACDGSTWERHYHEDGREYYYCLDTGITQCVSPAETEVDADNEASGGRTGNVPVGNEPTLGTTPTSPSSESFRAQQGSVVSVDCGREEQNASTIGDTGSRGCEGGNKESLEFPEATEDSGSQLAVENLHQEDKKSGFLRVMRLRQ